MYTHRLAAARSETRHFFLVIRGTFVRLVMEPIISNSNWLTMSYTNKYSKIYIFLVFIFINPRSSWNKVSAWLTGHLRQLVIALCYINLNIRKKIKWLIKLYIYMIIWCSSTLSIYSWYSRLLVRLKIFNFIFFLRAKLKQIN